MVTTAKSLGAIDKAKYLLQLLKENDISIRDLELALAMQAAQTDGDPTKISQSLDNLIANFKN